MPAQKKSPENKLTTAGVLSVSRKKAPGALKVVKEAEAAYATSVSPSKSKKLFASGKSLTLSTLSPKEKMLLLKNGITKNELERFKSLAGLDYDKLATTLSVTRATLINKKTEEFFTTSLSERIIDLSDVYAKGYEVFGNTESFNAWIFRPNAALGSQRPFDVLDNQFGRSEIRDILGRIATGVFS